MRVVRHLFGVSMTRVALAGAAMSVSAGCSGLGEEVDGFSAQDWALVEELRPLGAPQPPNPFNRHHADLAVARLGQMLFFDAESAEPLPADGPLGKKGQSGTHSCATCHDPNKSFSESRAGGLSYGRGGTASRRNTPAMVNLGYFEWAGWAGRFDSLAMHGAGAAEASGTRLGFAHFVARKYRAEYDAAFPETPLDPALDPGAADAPRFPATGRPKANAQAPDGPWEMMDPADQQHILQFMANIGRAYDAYPRQLLTRGSPFQAYLDGDRAALSPRAKNGLRLFVGKAACNDCHTGPILSDGKFYNIGVPRSVGETAADPGRLSEMAATLASPFNGAGAFSDDPDAGRRKLDSMKLDDAAMNGAFRTPMLLNVADTAPYFHTGAAHTLEEVVRHYNRGGGDAGSFVGSKDARLKPLGLSETEVADLVAFLESLTGAVDEEWRRDTAKR